MENVLSASLFLDNITASPNNVSLTGYITDTGIYNVSANGTGNLSRTPPDLSMSIPLYMYITVSLANAIVFTVGTVGNVLVIVVIVTVREMRTPTNIFLLNLSLADMLVLLVCQPAALLEFFGKDRWFLGEALCTYTVMILAKSDY